MIYNGGDFAASILHPAWIPVNCMGLLGCITLNLGIPSLLPGKRPRGETSTNAGRQLTLVSSEDGPSVTPGVLISQIGAILFAAIQYYETFLWPVAASMDSSMVAVQGPFVFGDLRVSIPLVLSGLILTVGFFLLMIELIRSGQKKTWPSLLFIGVLLFGMGMIVPVRTIGLMLMTAGLFHYSKAAAGKQIQD